MRAELIRSITRRLPLPGRITRRLLDRVEPLHYPTAPVTVEARGSQFQVRDFQDYMQRQIYFIGAYEFRETALVETILRPGDTFIDVGANIGWFTLLAARKVGAHGRVVAFEPFHPVFEHLRTNVGLNALQNIRLENIAIGSHEGTAVLQGFKAGNQGTGSIARLNDSADGQTVSVTTLDQYCAANAISKARMLKVDVEGAEGLVLTGAQATLAARVYENIIIEIIDSNLRKAGTSSAEVCATLRRCGYELFSIQLTGKRLFPPDRIIQHENLLAVAIQ